VMPLNKPVLANYDYEVDFKSKYYSQNTSPKPNNVHAKKKKKAT
jgi:hypothetical protein